MLFSYRKDSLTLILDLQSSIVRGSLVWMRPGLAPHVLFTYNKGIPYRPRGGSQFLIKTALHNISEVIDAVLRYHSIVSAEKKNDIPKHITDVHYVMSSPWTVSQAKTISSNFPHAVELTEEKLKAVIAEERSKIVSGDLADTEIIEEKIFDVRLNGYSVGEWRNRSTTELDVSFVISCAGKKMVARLREACKHIVKGSHVTFHSSLLLQYIGVRSLMPDRSSYTLIHVHGELTDIVVVENNACVLFGSYPMGIYTIVRKIAHAMNTDTHAADSLLTLYIAHHLDPMPEHNVLPVMNDMAEGWMGEFRKLLKDSGSQVQDPKNVVISCRAHEDFFTSTFKKTHPTANISLLGIDTLGTHVTFESTAEHKPLLGVYAFAIHSLKN